MGILFAFLAALLTSSSNFCMRRSIDAGGSTRAYLPVQITLSLVVMVFLNPVRTGDFGVDPVSIALGALGGVILAALMLGIGKTLERGPAGLTFAILSASSVIPAIVMALLFGVSYGHYYTFNNALGSLLVVGGLLWAGWTTSDSARRGAWAILALAIFGLHTLLLVFLQWWALVLNTELPLFALLPLHVTSEHTQWFMPTMFLVASLFLWATFLGSGTKKMSRQELFYGVIGGATNGVGTFFLVLAPQTAQVWENALIFPVYSVFIILFSNTWAQLLYKERVNWWANAACAFGLCIFSVF